MKKILIALLIGMSFIYSAQVVLIDGTRLTGEIISASDEEIQIKVSYSEDLIKINRENVLDIKFDVSAISSTMIHPESLKDLPSKTPSVNLDHVASRLDEAGENLVKFTGQYYAGAIMYFIGFTMILIAEEDENLIVAGSVFALFGSVFQFFSYSKARVAGVELKKAADEMKNINK